MAPRHSLPNSPGRPLADVLLGLATVVQRLRHLPEEHPEVTGSLGGLERALAGLLVTRESLIIKVGTVQLLVEGMETNPDFEPLRDLTAQLRDAGIGAIELRPGVTAAELLLGLSAVALSGAEQRAIPATANLTFRSQRPTPPAGHAPWDALERLALDDAAQPSEERDPDGLAVALELHPAQPEWRNRVLAALLAIAAQAVHNRELASDLELLIAALPLTTLRRLVTPDADPELVRDFIRESCGVLDAASLYRLAQALVPGREERLSPSVLPVLGRLARQAEDPRHTAARRALEEEVVRLVSDGATAPVGSRPGLEPERLLKLALESGILERGTLLAADRMIARRQVGPLLALLETVPREDPVARGLRSRVYHPQTVRVLLDTSPIDLDALDRLIPASGIEAAPVLLDALAQSGERRVRLRLLDLLTRYGQAIGPLAAERIEGMPWYVQRNLLALLGRLPDLPPDFSPAALRSHRDPRVRHEVLALSLTDPDLKEQAINDALDSEFEPTVRLAYGLLAERCPQDFVPRLMAHAADPRIDEEMRALAVAALAPVEDPVVLRLLRRMVVARGLTAMGRLAPRSPPMLAALRGLAAHWGSHPKVVPLLEAARQSRDAEVRDAARAPARRSHPTLPGVVG
ncbi:MAG: hypothetical protein ABI587_16655 [Gemmatimonadales bacterium]